MGTDGLSTAVEAKTSEPDSVGHKSSIIEAWEAKTLLARTLLKGTRGMKLAGKAFLPQHTLEGDLGYNERLKCSTLLNAFAKTSSFLSGQVFQKDPIFDEAVDQKFLDMAERITAAGDSFSVYAKRNFQNGLGKGVVHTLVDMPKKDENIVTQKDEEEAGIRPYFKEIKPEDILGFIEDEDGFIVQVRISESITKRVGKYGTKTFDRVRVLEPGQWELFEADDDSKSLASIDSGSFSINIIPLLTFIPGDPDTQMTAPSPLDDLSELNGKHWRTSSDQDNYLTYCRFPLYFGRMLSDIPILPAGKTLINSDDENSDLKTVEMTGTSIKAGAEDVKETEAQMALYGLQQLLPRVGNMTATEKAITSAESNSSLSTWATEFEDYCIQCFQVMGMFIGMEFPDNSIEMNKEYNFGVADPQELMALLAAKEAGVASAQETFIEFRRRGVYQDTTEWDDMSADIEQEKRESLEMSQLAGSAFGEEEGGEEGA